MNGHEDVVRLLLDRSARVDAGGNVRLFLAGRRVFAHTFCAQGQETALIRAAVIGHIGIARLLLARGAGVEATNQVLSPQGRIGSERAPASHLSICIRVAVWADSADDGCGAWL